MIKRHLTTSLSLVLALGVSGCPSVRPTAAPAPLTKLKPNGPTPLDPDATTPDTGLGAGTTPVAAIITNGGANLSGVVRLPASIVSNNGGSIIGNNGGTYRIAAKLEQVPLQNARVELVDAAGHPVLVGGQAAVATTDASGRYSFAGIQPGRNLLVVCTLPGQRGTARAIVPKNSRATSQVNIDLVSSLTTAYILSQYVTPQKDPLATLDKLPAQVDDDTRTKAQAALEGGAAAVPDALTTEKAVETVEQLRQRDAAFNQQMETVKNLLILAGRSDLGEGQLATEVALETITSLSVEPDGSLIFSCPADQRLWRLGRDGRLKKVVARQNGASVDRFDAQVLYREPSGAVLLFGRRAIARLKPDGELQVLSGGPFAAGGSASEPLGLLSGLGVAYGTRISGMDAGASVPATVIWAAEGDRVVEVGRYAGEAGVALSYASAIGRHAEGTLLIRSRYPKVDGSPRLPSAPGWVGLPAWVGGLFNLPASGPPTAVTIPSDEELEHSTVAIDGSLFYVAQGALFLVEPVGPPSKLLATAEDFPLGELVPAVDGGWYSVDYNVIYRLKDGAVSRVAGRQDPSLLNLHLPSGLAFDADNALLVLDNEVDRLYRYQRGQAPVVVLDQRGDEDSYLSAAPVRVDAAGMAYVMRGGGLVKVTPQGGVQKVTLPAIAPPADYDEFDDRQAWSLSDFDFLPDGSLAIALNWDPNGRVIRVRPGSSQAEVLLDLTSDSAQPFDGWLSVAAGADGSVTILGAEGETGKLWRWSPSGGLKLLLADERFLAARQADDVGLTGIAVDRQGRVYWPNYRTGTLDRYDPASNAHEIIAGPGGRIFNGNTADDSVGEPLFPAFDREGNLAFSDRGTRQVKKIPAARL